MTPHHAFIFRRSGPMTACATLLLYAAVAAAQSQTTPPGENAPAGRIDFGRANLPPANVEVDLSQGMFNDLFGISDAVVQGIAESLVKAADANRAAEGTRMAAEKLAAARQILQLAREVVREVRVRAYEKMPAEATAGSQFEKLMGQFDDQLRAGNWENVLLARRGNENARVALLRKDGAIRGTFIIAGDGRSLVLANVVADVSPENIKKLSSAAATIGLENGLQQAIEQQMRQMQRQSMPQRATLSPPTPSAPAVKAAVPAATVTPEPAR